MRVVLDSSVLIAAYVSRAGICAELYEDILEHHDLIVSMYILDEVARTLREKFLIDDDLVRRTVDAIARVAHRVEPAAIAPHICRDPSDLPILGTAVAGGADVLITVDKDLLAIYSLGSIAILRPGEFWSRSPDSTRR